MHEFGGADDGVDGAGLDAVGAADAVSLGDVCVLSVLLSGVDGVELGNRLVGELSQCADACGASGWALVNWLCVKCDGAGIRCAAAVTALGALRLWQGGVDLFKQLLLRHKALKPSTGEGLGEFGWFFKLDFWQ